MKVLLRFFINEYASPFVPNRRKEVWITGRINGEERGMAPTKEESVRMQWSQLIRIQNVRDGIAAAIWIIGRGRLKHHDDQSRPLT